MSRSRPFRLGVFIVFWLAGSGVMAADITASISRDGLARNETLQLVLEMSGESDAPPDVSPLYQDFEILWRSQSQSTRVINGNVQHRASLTLTLRPKRAGQLEIPAIAFDRVATDPIPIEVNEAVVGAGEPEFGQRPMSPFEQVPGSGQFASPPPFQGYGPSRMPSSRWGNGAAGPLQPSAPAAPSPSLTMPGFQGGAQARTDQPLRSPPDIDAGKPLADLDIWTRLAVHRCCLVVEPAGQAITDPGASCTNYRSPRGGDRGRATCGP
jgi:hypothetical protein